MRLKSLLLVATIFVFTAATKPVQEKILLDTNKTGIRTGAEQTEKYLPLLKGKRVAVMANQTTMIGKTHLVDSLKTLGVNIVKVFGHEHGFRGNASAGVRVADEIDPAQEFK